MRKKWMTAALAGAFVSSSARAAFNSGDLLVVQLGGTAATAQSVTILDYNFSGGIPSLLGSHTLPTTVATNALTLGGTGSHDGHLNLSGDGNYLTIAGYRADVGSAAPINQSSGSVNRVLGLIDSNWNMNTSTALNDAYNGTEIDSVVTNDGKEFWTGGDIGSNSTNYTSAGLRYVSAVGATTSLNISQTQNNTSSLQPDSMRNLRINNGQLYVTTASAGSYGNRGLYATTDPLPTTGPLTMIPLMNNVEGNSSIAGQELGPDSTGKFAPKTDLVFADLSSTIPGYDTAYGTGGKAEYEKWSLISDGSGGYSWKQVALYNLTGVADINALALNQNGTSVSLFIANSSGVYDVQDNTGYIGIQPTSAAGTFTLTGLTPIITPAAGTEFRGIVSVPEPTALGLMAFAGALLGGRRRREGTCK